MKRLVFMIAGMLSGVLLYAQQMPLSENYFTDKYSLSPSYAGNFNKRFLFLGYRSDWSGIDDGPQTLVLSYSDAFMQNAGFGGRIILDKAGLFRQFLVLGTYSYKIKLFENHLVMFGLSAGFYKNSLDLNDYYNDPKYSLDPSLVNADITSKSKFMSDVSAVYLFKGIEAGFLFSNVSFGYAKYPEVPVRYKPLANFQAHAGYTYNISKNWELSHLVILRGGKYIRSQYEIASQVIYQKIAWTSILYRDRGIIGIGIGTNIKKELIIGYHFNFATSVSPRFFNNHEITLGINFYQLTHRRIGIEPERVNRL
jgi:type IX secretion system PorP/SprF family membrane protein